MGRRPSPPLRAIFRRPGPYVHWLMWTHLSSAAGVALGATAALLWLGWGLGLLRRPGWVFVARAAVALALSSMAVSLWLAGTAPTLTVARRAFTQAVRASLARRMHLSAGAVSTPAWAFGACRRLLAHYALYLRGRFSPSLPAGYRLLLLSGTEQSVLAGILAHNSAPLPVVAHELVSAVVGRVPASTLAAAASADRIAVGLWHGTAVTAGRHTPLVLMAVFVGLRAAPGGAAGAGVGGNQAPASPAAKA